MSSGCHSQAVQWPAQLSCWLAISPQPFAPPLPCPQCTVQDCANCDGDPRVCQACAGLGLGLVDGRCQVGPRDSASTIACSPWCISRAAGRRRPLPPSLFTRALVLMLNTCLYTFKYVECSCIAAFMNCHECLRQTRTCPAPPAPLTALVPQYCLADGCDVCASDLTGCLRCSYGYYRRGRRCFECSDGCLEGYCNADGTCGKCKPTFGLVNGTCLQVGGATCAGLCAGIPSFRRSGQYGDPVCRQAAPAACLHFSDPALTPIPPHPTPSPSTPAVFRHEMPGGLQRPPAALPARAVVPTPTC